MAISLTGIPGAGKGTQRKKIANELSFGGKGFVEVGASDILGEKARTDSNYRGEMTLSQQTGDLASDHLVIDPILDFIKKNGHEKNLVLDGCIRSPRQAQIIPRWLVERGYTLTICWLRMDSEKSKERLASRLVNGERREDDSNPEAVQNRHSKYYEHRPQILGQLVGDGHSIHVVNASLGISEVFEEICRITGIVKSESHLLFKDRRVVASS